jgi:hypothetical protein
LVHAVVVTHAIGQARFELKRWLGTNYKEQNQVAILAELADRSNKVCSQYSLIDQSGLQFSRVFVAVTHLKAKIGFEARRLEQGTVACPVHVQLWVQAKS